jgi:Zn finger protein HypA/HybF involved in hydrogenase expression
MSSIVIAPLGVHLVIWLVIGIIAVATFAYAVSTRRQVVCRSCGERIRMEHDRVHQCPSCGAPLA